MLLSAATEWTKTKRATKLFPNLCFRSSSKASHPSQESRNNSPLKRFLLQLLKVNDNGGNCAQPTASGLWQLHPEVLVITRESDTDFLPNFLITADLGALGLFITVCSEKFQMLFLIPLPPCLTALLPSTQLHPCTATTSGCISCLLHQNADWAQHNTAALRLCLAQKLLVLLNKTS